MICVIWKIHSGDKRRFHSSKIHWFYSEKIKKCRFHTLGTVYLPIKSFSEKSIFSAMTEVDVKNSSIIFRRKYTLPWFLQEVQNKIHSYFHQKPPPELDPIHNSKVPIKKHLIHSSSYHINDSNKNDALKISIFHWGPTSISSIKIKETIKMINKRWERQTKFT